MSDRSTIWEQPNRELIELEFHNRFEQLKEKYPRLDFNYQRVDQINKKESTFYTEENLTRYSEHLTEGTNLLAEEIISMKSRYDGITAEEAYKRHSDENDILSATTALVVLDLFTPSTNDFNQLKDDKQMMLDVLKEIFEIVKELGVQVYIKSEENTIGDFEATIADVMIVEEDFPDILLEQEPEMAGTKSIKIADELVLIFE